jgi:hypothetical protein
MENQEISKILEELKELQFEEERHIYTYKGMRLPSVTQLMDPLNDKYYKNVNRDCLQFRADIGTQVHQAAQIYWETGFIDIPKGLDGYMNAFLKFVAEYNPKPIAVEVRFWHKQLLYAGTSDLICTLQGNDEPWLIDYKTSTCINKMLTSIQLEGYKQGLESHGLEIKHKAILHLKKNGDYTFDSDYSQNDKTAIDVLNALLTLYRYEKLYGKN